MPTDPLIGARYPALTAVPNVPQDIANAVLDLTDNTIPHFTTTSLRDTAYASWVAAGNTMRNGLFCSVAGVAMEYDTTYAAWGAPIKYGVEINRTVTTAVGNNTAENQGITSGQIVLDRGQFYNGSGLDILKVPATLGGLYHVSIKSVMAGVVLGRHIAIVTSGSAATQLFRANGAYDDTAYGSALIRFSGNQTLGIQILQASGATLNNTQLNVSMYLMGH